MFPFLEDIKRVDNSGGIAASLAGRYATALFQLAQESKAIDKVESSFVAIDTALNESKDFKALTTNPLITRDQASDIVAALSKKMKLDPLTTKTLGVLAQNRRLSEIASVSAAFQKLAANDRGEIRADVTSARPLSAAQEKELQKQLKKRMGSDVALTLNTDPEILGGLIVKIGSEMIDSSIKTRLNTLSHAMKG